MLLTRLVSRYHPELRDYPRTWLDCARQQWTFEPEWMIELTRRMRDQNRWLYGPVILRAAAVQDGHHRIVVALGLGWQNRTVPVLFVPAALRLSGRS